MSSSSPSRPDGSGAPATATPETVAPGSRNVLLDGIRGLAIVLVLLHHGWALWPAENLSSGWQRVVFHSGNIGVSIFFVVGAFLATRSLLGRVDSPRDLVPDVVLVRRYIRLSGQLVVLLVAVLVVTALDDASSYPDANTGSSVWRVLTYTFNWYLVDHAFTARPDLGHLWYLSVDLQVFVLVLVLVYLLGRYRVWLLTVLGTLVVFALFWRSHAFESEGEYRAMLQTVSRMDAPLMGALAATALPYLTRLQRQARSVLVASVVSLLPLLVLTDTEASFMGWPGAAVSVALGLFVLGSVLAPAPRALRVTLGSAPLVFLGRRSLSIYLWHYPVFWWVARHTTDWHWEARTVLGLALTFLIAELSERLVEVRVQRWLAAPGWRQVDRGFAPYAVARARSWWRAEDRA